MITLTPREMTIPVEATGILPERLRGLSKSEIEQIPVHCGNRTSPLAEFFRVEKSGDGDELIFDGDCSRVKQIGERMAFGSIRVTGSVGWLAGAEMSGGTLRIEGDAADMLGVAMSGGRIDVARNAGNCVGGAYRGSRRGMLGGEILIRGNVGDEAGHTMRRGLIVVCGSAGAFAGCQMLAGTILIGGKVGLRCGVGLKRGTILVRQGVEIPLGFRSSGQVSLNVVRVLRRYLESQGVTLPAPFQHDRYIRYCGDVLEGDRGEILVADES